MATYYMHRSAAKVNHHFHPERIGTMFFVGKGSEKKLVAISYPTASIDDQEMRASESHNEDNHTANLPTEASIPQGQDAARPWAATVSLSEGTNNEDSASVEDCSTGENGTNTNVPAAAVDFPSDVLPIEGTSDYSCEKDILLQPGKHFAKRKANIWWSELLTNQKSKYLLANTQGKRKIVEMIEDLLKKQERRLLRVKKSSNTCVPQSDISQKLRDKGKKRKIFHFQTNTINPSVLRVSISPIVENSPEITSRDWEEAAVALSP